MALAIRMAAGSDATTAIMDANRLAPTMAYPSVFCDTAWLTAAAAMEPVADLVVLQIRDGDVVVALLPLVRRRNRLGGSDLVLLGAEYYPDPLGVICDERVRTDSIRLIRDLLASGALHCDRMVLTWMHEDEASLWAKQFERVSCEPYLALPTTFDELLKTFKKKKRYNLNASVSKFTEAGGQLLRGGADASNEALLQTLFKLHAKRSMERGIESSIASPRVYAFHQRLVVGMKDTRFYALAIDRRIIAVLYGFEFCGRFMYYQIAHDPEFASLSPGGVLLGLVIKDCCERGLREFNFMQDAEVYKWGWTKTGRELYRAVLIGRNPRAKLLAALRAVKRVLKARLKARH